jgi:hypothetical protein
MSIMHQGKEPEAYGEEKKAEPQKKISISFFSFSLALPIGGTIGAGTGAPTYGEAFGPGVGVAASGGFRLLPAVEGRLGLGFERFAASSFDLTTPAGTQSNELSDYSVFWFAAGPRVYFLVDRPTDDWFTLKPKKAYRGFAPFAGFQIGLTFTGAVDWPTPPPEWSYWDSGVSAFFELYGGAEFRFTEAFGVFAELGLTVFGAPNPASLPTSSPGSFAGMNEAGSMMALRVALGVLAAF